VHVKELFDLSGQVALVTGGGRGLGKQIAEGLGEAGAHVIICSRKLENCQKTEQEFLEREISCRAFECDVTEKEEVERTVRQIIEEFGKIDILVNNSGATWGASAEEMPLEAWNKVFAVNVTGTFLLSQCVGKFMIENKFGKIINVASAAGLRAEPPEVLDAIGYSTSKAAVIHFTKDLARKWARYGVYVNALAPGFFPSKMTKSVLEQKGEKILAHIPLGKFGDENMLKGAALFLSSRASDFVTGHILTVDGGSSL
jgi:NAD(P)-dependent dehydrogenase (short-subunit alcohol dehydrogenase family)